MSNLRELGFKSESCLAVTFFEDKDLCDAPDEAMWWMIGLNKSFARIQGYYIV